MGEYTDLDELLGDDKRVKLGGKNYVLPPDLPVELFLRINRFAQAEHTEVEQVEALYEELLSLFRYKMPNLKTLPVSMTQLAVAIGYIYSPEAPEDEPAPPPRRRSGGATKTGRNSRR